MKFVAISQGTTGDLLPLAIVLEDLEKRGHESVLVAASAFAGLAAEFDLRFIPTAPWGGEDALANEMRAVNSRRRKDAVLSGMYEQLSPRADSIGSLLDAEIRNADALLLNSLFPFWAQIAQKRNLPSIAFHYCHEALPSRNRVPAPFPLPPKWTGPLRQMLARQIWTSADRYVSRLTTRALFRHHPLSFDRIRNFLYRPADFALIPLPASLFADPGLDLKVPSAFTGYLRRKPAPIPDPVRERLEAFCRGERVPVIAFGSMRTDRIEQDLRRLFDARPPRQRCILIRGWGAIPPDLDSNEVLVLDPTPHEWVLPFASVFLHHGGAGTTAAGLVSGIPQLIRPFFADQPFWAAEVSRLGCGSRAAPFYRSPKIWKQLSDLGSDPRINQRTREVASQISNESNPSPADTILDWIRPLRSSQGFV